MQRHCLIVGVIIMLLITAPEVIANNQWVDDYDGTLEGRRAALEHIGQGEHPLARGSSGLTIPFMAAVYLDMDFLEMYKEAGIDFNTHVLFLEQEQHTVFSWYVKVDGTDLTILSTLIDWGVNPHLELTGRRALYHGVINNNIAVVRYLLDLGVSPHGVFTKDQPIQHAAKLGHFEIVLALLAANADIFSLDQSGKSALEWIREHATESKDLYAVQALDKANAIADTIWNTKAMTIQDAQRMLGYPESVVGVRIGYPQDYRFRYAILDSGFAGLLEWLAQHPEEKSLTHFAYDISEDTNDHGYWVYRVVRAIAPDADLYIGRGLEPQDVIWLYENQVKMGSMSVGYASWIDPDGSNLNQTGRRFIELIEQAGIFLFTAIGNEFLKTYTDFFIDTNQDGWLEAQSILGSPLEAQLHIFEVHPSIPLHIRVSSNHWEVPNELSIEIITLDDNTPLPNITLAHNAFNEIVITGDHGYFGEVALRIGAEGVPIGMEERLKVRIYHVSGTRGFKSNGAESGVFPGTVSSPYVISVGSFGRDPITKLPVPSDFSSISHHSEIMPMLHGPGELIIDNRVIQGTSFATPFIGAFTALRPVISPYNLMEGIASHDLWAEESDEARVSRWGIPTFDNLHDNSLPVFSGQTEVSQISAESIDGGGLRIKFVVRRPYMEGMRLLFYMELLDPQTGEAIPSVSGDAPLLIQSTASYSTGHLINRWVHMNILPKLIPEHWRGKQAYIRTYVSTSLWPERRQEIPELSGTLVLPN